MNNFEAITERLRAEMDREHAAREAALPLGREIVRLAANTIRAAHREQFAQARALLAEARAKVVQTRERFAAEYPEIYGAGYVQDAHKEYVEASLVVAIFEGAGEWPDPEALGVTAAAYLNGLGEAVGECRRRALDLMRRDELGRADALLSVMDTVYEALVTFDYPDAVTGGLRRTTDMVRGVLERTRADVALTLAQERLRQDLWRVRGTNVSESPSEDV